RVPVPVRTDAGVSLASKTSPVIVPRKMGDARPPPKRHTVPKHGGPYTNTDPRVLACTHNPATSRDWSTLRACLQGIPVDSSVVPLGDAGMKKMGAMMSAGPPPGPACGVPYWSVNWLTGKDSNGCVTFGTPCQTMGEIQARRGPNCANAGVEIELEQDSP